MLPLITFNSNVPDYYAKHNTVFLIIGLLVKQYCMLTKSLHLKGAKLSLRTELKMSDINSNIT